jgi:DNA-binding NarL/FixJ family response regulator
MRLVRDGFTHSEIARRLGIPIGTVKSRMAKAADTLRAELGITVLGGDHIPLAANQVTKVQRRAIRKRPSSRRPSPVSHPYRQSPTTWPGR